MKKIPKRLIVRFSRFVLVRPRLKQALVRVLDVFPSGKAWLKRILFQPVKGAPDHLRSRTIAVLSPRATQILCDLKKAMGRD